MVLPLVASEICKLRREKKFSKKGTHKFCVKQTRSCISTIVQNPKRKVKFQQLHQTKRETTCRNLQRESANELYLVWQKSSWTWRMKLEAFIKALYISKRSKFTLAFLALTSLSSLIKPLALPVFLWKFPFIFKVIGLYGWITNLCQFGNWIDLLHSLSQLIQTNTPFYLYKGGELLT